VYLRIVRDCLGISRIVSDEDKGYQTTLNSPNRAYVEDVLDPHVPLNEFSALRSSSEAGEERLRKPIKERTREMALIIERGFSEGQGEGETRAGEGEGEGEGEGKIKAVALTNC
jgi:hypothetical protein